MIYQIIYIVLTLIGLFFVAYKHGKQKEEKHNFWSSLLSSVIIFYVLVKGGFFDVILNKF